MKSIFHVLSSVTLAWVWMSAGPLANAQAPQAQPDLAVIHAEIHTVDDKTPLAEAIAMKDGRIIAIGSSTSIKQICGPQTRVIDAGGKLVVPGFNDAHVHFTAGGRQLSSVQLRDAQSPEEFTRRLKAFAEKLPKGTWITGGDWDHENFLGAPLPTRRWIDDVTSDHPVFITRLDGHMGLANSTALHAAGIDKSTPDPDGGLIVRDPKTGEATGILKDAAMNLVTARIPAPSHEQRSAAALAATNHAVSLGVTSVQDMSGADDVIIYRELLKRGDLKTRIYAAAPLPRWQRSADQGLKAATGDMWIREGALKGFADGSLGSTTAFFFEPYADDPRTPGLPSDEMFPAGAMQARIEQADREGLQIMIHAIGDRANDQILSLFESTAQRNGSRDRRFRIEHAQHLRMQDIARFGKAGVIASMQPYHCADDGRWAEKRIGAERARGTYAFRSLLDSRARLAFGSDWNVAPLDPIQGIAAAVTRQTLDGAHPDGWVPEQKITVEEAVRAYTLGSAYAEFTEQEKGSLSVGKLADLVILSDDLFTIPVADIPRVRVTLTIVDGRVVYEAP